MAVPLVRVRAGAEVQPLPLACYFGKPFFMAKSIKGKPEKRRGPTCGPGAVIRFRQVRLPAELFRRKVEQMGRSSRSEPLPTPFPPPRRVWPHDQNHNIGPVSTPRPSGLRAQELGHKKRSKNEIDPSAPPEEQRAGAAATFSPKGPIEFREVTASICRRPLALIKLPLDPLGPQQEKEVQRRLRPAKLVSSPATSLMFLWTEQHF